MSHAAWTLIIGQHTFKKHRNKNDFSYFSCNDCLRDKKTISAIAEYEFGDDEHGTDDNFTLVHAPSMDQHVCQVSGTGASIKVARYKIKILGDSDGTSKICPKLWTQVFIIRRLLHSMHIHFLARQVQNII